MATYTGLVSCKGQFIQPICILGLVECTISLALSIASIVLYIQKYRQTLRFFSNKQITIALILLSNIFYILFIINKESVYYYFLLFFVQYMYFTFVIYYFALKSAKITNIHQVILIRLFLVGMLAFFLVITIYNFIEYYKDTVIYSLCHEVYFDIIRSVGFFMQLMFCVLGASLSRSVYRLKNSLIVKNEYETRVEDKIIRIELRLNQLKLLIIVNFIGTSILFLENMYYMLQQRNPNFDCRLIPANSSSTTFYNWSDIGNALIALFIAIMANFLPFYLSLRLFFLTLKQKSTSASTELSYTSYQAAQYFRGLTYKQHKSSEQQSSSNKSDVIKY